MATSNRLTEYSVGVSVTDFSNRVVGGKKEKSTKSIYFWNAKKKIKNNKIKCRKILLYLPTNESITRLLLKLMCEFMQIGQYND